MLVQMKMSPNTVIINAAFQKTTKQSEFCSGFHHRIFKGHFLLIHRLKEWYYKLGGKNWGLQVKQKWQNSRTTPWGRPIETN
jgi:hypothetical protein